MTCAGVKRDEVNFKTMESRRLPGEVMDIDALTSGYNLQAAWTTGAIGGG